MPKFYIKSGDLKFIIDRADYNIAIRESVVYAKNNNIITAPKICISEKGFLTFKEWTCYDIKDYSQRI